MDEIRWHRSMIVNGGSYIPPEHHYCKGVMSGRRPEFVPGINLVADVFTCDACGERVYLIHGHHLGSLDRDGRVVRYPDLRPKASVPHG
jgi:hypothetical protein